MSTYSVIYEQRDIEYQDERHTLVTAFNGDFSATSIRAVVTGADPFDFSHQEDENAKLFCLLRGRAELRVNDGSALSQRYSLAAEPKRWWRIIVPSDHSYHGIVHPHSILIGCAERFSHDERKNEGEQKMRRIELADNLYHRSIVDESPIVTLLDPITSGTPTAFRAAQLTFALAHQESVLGKQYHTCQEFFYLLEGEAAVRLENIGSLVREERSLEDYFHSRLWIPPRTAHAVRLKEHSILVSCAEEVFHPASENIRHYSNPWLEFRE